MRCSSSILRCNKSSTAGVALTRPSSTRSTGLNLMTQIAHGRDAGHARTTFQRMQMTLELVHRLCRTLPDPVDQCLVG